MREVVDVLLVMTIIIIMIIIIIIIIIIFNLFRYVFRIKYGFLKRSHKI